MYDNVLWLRRVMYLTVCNTLEVNAPCNYFVVEFVCLITNFAVVIWRLSSSCSDALETAHVNM